MNKSSIIIFITILGCNLPLIDKETWEKLENANLSITFPTPTPSPSPSPFVTLTPPPSPSQILPPPTPTTVNEEENSIDDEVNNEKSLPPKKKNCKRFYAVNDGYKNGFVMLKSSTLPIYKVIFPSSFYQKFKSVFIIKDDVVIDKLKFSGFANPDYTKKERQHWNGTTTINKIPNQSFIFADNNCFLLKKITDRID